MEGVIPRSASQLQVAQGTCEPIRNPTNQHIFPPQQHSVMAISVVSTLEMRKQGSEGKNPSILLSSRRGQRPEWPAPGSSALSALHLPRWSCAHQAWLQVHKAGGLTRGVILVTGREHSLSPECGVNSAQGFGGLRGPPTVKAPPGHPAATSLCPGTVRLCTGQCKSSWLGMRGPSVGGGSTGTRWTLVPH